MITISTGKNISTKYKDYIDDCVNALFCSFIGNYDIHVNFRKFIDTDHVHAGFCLGDNEESVIDIATWSFYQKK